MSVAKVRVCVCVTNVQVCVYACNKCAGVCV